MLVFGICAYACCFRNRKAVEDAESGDYGDDALQSDAPDRFIQTNYEPTPQPVMIRLDDRSTTTNSTNPKRGPGFAAHGSYAGTIKSRPSSTRSFPDPYEYEFRLDERSTRSNSRNPRRDPGYATHGNYEGTTKSRSSSNRGFPDPYEYEYEDRRRPHSRQYSSQRSRRGSDRSYPDEYDYYPHDVAEEYRDSYRSRGRGSQCKPLFYESWKFQ